MTGYSAIGYGVTVSRKKLATTVNQEDTILTMTDVLKSTQISPTEQQTEDRF